MADSFYGATSGLELERLGIYNMQKMTDDDLVLVAKNCSAISRDPDQPKEERDKARDYQLMALGLQKERKAIRKHTERVLQLAGQGLKVGEIAKKIKMDNDIVYWFLRENHIHAIPELRGTVPSCPDRGITPTNPEGR